MRVDSRENLNIPPFGYAIDYMTFGGMYREVYVQVRNKTHLADVFIKPQIHPLQVTTEITVQNISDGITLQQEIRKKGEGAYRSPGKKAGKTDKCANRFSSAGDLFVGTGKSTFV